MPDNRKKGLPNPSNVSGSEVGTLARKHGITRDQAKRLIKRFGSDRKKIDDAAAKLAAR